ncbi:MAG: GNAT family N-acetyltransferase, partial [Lentisphaeria bacterium]
KYPLMVVRDHNKKSLKAWVSLSPFYGRPAFSSTAEISLYIHQDYRNQKIGSHIISEIKSMMPTLGFTTLLAFIFSHNIPSMKLFQNHNFLTWGEMPYIAKIDGNLYSLSILGFKI